MMNNNFSEWDIKHLKHAEFMSTYSKDDSVKVGCIIVGSMNEVLATGYNGFPRGIKEMVNGELISERWHLRPDKYSWIEHAERNALYNSNLTGVSLLGSTAYINFEPQPCCDCLRGFIQSGIKRVVGIDREFTGQGKNVHYDLGNIGSQMLYESKLEVTAVPSDRVLGE